MFMFDFKVPTGAGFVLTDKLGDLFILIERNYTSFSNYRQKTPIRYNNSNRLVTLIQHIEDYIGSTPNETAQLISSRVNNISRIFNLVTPGVTPGNIDFGVGMSVICPTTHSDNQILHCYHHDATSLDAEYYLNDNSSLLTVISIDLPLLGKTLHEYKLENDYDYNIDKFITSKLLIPVCKDFINLAYFNTVADTGIDTGSLNSTSYMRLPLEAPVTKAKKDLDLMLSNFRGNAADVIESFPAPFGLGMNVADLELEYGTNYQAFSYLTETLRLEKVKALNEILPYPVKLKSIERQAKIFTSYALRKRLTDMLPSHIQTAYSFLNL